MRNRLAADASADARAELLALLEARLDPATCAKAKQLLAAMAEDDVTPPDRPAGSAPTPAMDRRYAMDSGDGFTRMRDLTAAEREVAPHVGEILGMDSAAAVFREALVRLGAPAPTVHHSALPTLFRTAARNRRTAAAGGRPTIAHDAAGSAAFERRFPGADRIRNVG